DCDARYPYEVADLIEVTLRISSQVVVEADEDIVPAQARVPIAEMKSVPVYSINMRAGLDHFVKGGAGPDHFAHQLVVGVSALNRIAQTHDNPAVRHMPRDPFASFGNLEVAADLTDWQLRICLPEVA